MTKGVTDNVVPIPIGVPPQPPVYQYQFAPGTDPNEPFTTKVVEVPGHRGNDADENTEFITEGVITVTGITSQEPMPQLL